MKEQRIEMIYALKEKFDSPALDELLNKLDNEDAFKAAVEPLLLQFPSLGEVEDAGVSSSDTFKGH